MSDPFRTGVLAFRKRVEAHLYERRQARLQRIKESDEAIPVAALKSFRPAADVQALVQELLAVTLKDIQSYHTAPTAAPADPAAAPPTDPIAPVVPVASSGYTQATRQKLAFVLNAPNLPVQTPQDAAARFQALLDNELKSLTEESALLGKVGAAFVPKLKNAEQAFQAGRHADAVTILRSALRNEPHNGILLFITSQFQYFMASNGQQDALPMAREMAQKAMIFSERLPPDKLTHYRYHSVATEAGLDMERALGWIREHNLLDPTPMQKAAGLAAQEGLPLKTWAVLATIPANLWGEPELKAINKLVQHVVGGGALYLALLRPRLAEATLGRKEPHPLIDKIENDLATTLGLYQAIATPLEKFPAGNGQLPWLIRTRYLNALAVVPRPTFDQVLLNICLNGDRWEEGAYPEPETQNALGEQGLNYWRLWTYALTLKKESRQPHLLPTAETLAETEILADADALLATLRQGENTRIRPMAWEEIKPWMIRWQIDHLLAAGTGTNQPRDKFMPQVSPFNTLYRRWNEPPAAGLLSSEMIYSTAQRGGFADLSEILAAFEGAFRLIDDPAYGLHATQKRALKAAKDQNPGKYDHLRIDDGLSGSHLLMMLMPLVLIGGIAGVMMMSRNMGQAIGLSLALAGFIGVAMISLSRKT